MINNHKDFYETRSNKQNEYIICAIFRRYHVKSTVGKKLTNVSRTNTEPQKPKSNKKLTAFMMILAILLLGISAFTIYSFIEMNNKTTEISNLNLKIEQLEEQIDSASNSSDQDNPKPEDNPKQEKLDGGKIFYLDEFGLKVVLEENTIITGFEYEKIQSYDDAVNMESVYTTGRAIDLYKIWGGYMDGDGSIIAVRSTNNHSEPGVTIRRFANKDDYCLVSCGEKIYEDENYIYTAFPNLSDLLDQKLNDASSFIYHDSGFSNPSNYFLIDNH